LGYDFLITIRSLATFGNKVLMVNIDRVAYPKLDTAFSFSMWRAFNTDTVFIDTV
jgi:hypothetical protein